MGLLTETERGIAVAMKARDQVRLSTLRMLKAALLNKDVEKGGPLDDKESLQVVSSLVKQRKDSIEQFGKAGRQDLVDKETAELAVLEGLLPPPIDPAEVERLVAETVAETGATSAKDMGKVMKGVMAKLAGQSVDGKLVNELVRRRLSS
jgi:uncharacterized protein YqeY